MAEPEAALPARPDGFVKPPTKVADDEMGYGGLVSLDELLLGVGRLMAVVVDDGPESPEKKLKLEAAL